MIKIGMPEAIWASNVDNAGPLTPRGIHKTNTKSNRTLTLDEIIKNIKGVLEFPIALSMLDPILNNVKNTSPDKTIYKYCFAYKNDSDGTWNSLNNGFKNTIKTIDMNKAIAIIKIIDVDMARDNL